MSAQRISMQVIEEKVRAGERLLAEDGRFLFAEAGLLSLGRLPSFSLGFLDLAIEAREVGLISAASLEAIEGLTVMRNLAAHGRAQEDLDAARAIEYLDLADAVLYGLRHRPPGTGLR